MDKEYYKDLSARAADGDAKSFSKLYELIYRGMYYTAYYTLPNEKDAVDAVIGAARDGFKSIGRLRSEEAFEAFMMKTLCSRIKTICKENSETSGDADENEIKKAFMQLEDYMDRLCAALYIACRLDVSIIAAYTGTLRGSVKKRLSTALRALDLE